jgi:hypothetical protein
MKDLRACLRSILLADPAINAAVDSGNGIYRVYPVIVPQGEKRPSIVQNLIFEDAPYHMAGDSNFVGALTQLDCWAQSHDAAVNLAGLVFERLSGYKGLTLYGTGNSLQMLIGGIFHDNGRDDYDAVAIMYVRRRDYRIWYEPR